MLVHKRELPLEIIRMKAKGVQVYLSRNAGFTLPSNIGELGGDITKLDLSNCSLTGPRSTRTERLLARWCQAASRKSLRS